jgi:SnoaL-like domain
MTDPALQALLDNQQIAELLTSYLRSVDRGDVATLRACYLPGATEDHGGLFAGPAQDYVDSVAAALTHPRARTSPTPRCCASAPSSPPTPSTPPLNPHHAPGPFGISPKPP